MRRQSAQEEVHIEKPLGDVENPQAKEDDQGLSKNVPENDSWWWSRKRVLLAVLLVGSIVVALTVGLSVGLTTRNKNRPSSSPLTSSSTPHQKNNNHDGANNTANKTSGTTPPKAVNPSFVVSSTLTSFGQQVLEPYSSCDDFLADLTKAVEHLVNTSIDASAQAYFHHNYNTCLECNTFSSDDDADPVPPAGGSPSQETSTGGDGISSFGTNNQVDGVDQADMVKSNGVHVFSAFGSEIIVVDATNASLLSRTSIPLPNISTFYPDVNFSALNTSSTSTSNSDSGSSSSGSTKNAASPRIGPYYLYYRQPTSGTCWTWIKSLLLTGDRLVAIASQACYYVDENHTTLQPILTGANTTAIFVYDISSVPADGTSPLTLTSQSSVYGRYNYAQTINSSAYLVTNCDISTYNNLLREFERDYFNYLNPNNKTETEYRVQAYAAAKKVIPAYVRQLVSQIKNATRTTSCNNVIRLALLQTSQLNTSYASEHQLAFTSSRYVLSTLMLVTSFNVDQVAGINFVPSTVGLLLPTPKSTVYSNRERLIVAGQGWHQREDGWWWEETYLWSFRLNGNAIQADAVGQVPGYTTDQFSLDIWEDDDDAAYLRVGTVTSEHWRLVDGYWNQTLEFSNQLFVLQFPPDGSTDRVLSEVGNITTDVSVSGTVTDVLGAVLKWVRFFGDDAFIYTRNDTGPFLTMDLSTPSAPKVVGELNVAGQITYLQPIANGTQILALGQVATDEGGTILQIYLFDVLDKSKPKLIQTYAAVSGSNNEFTSFSGVINDFKAFRYLEQPKLLIIPIRRIIHINYTISFDGFLVYNIDPTAGISPRFTVEHVDKYSRSRLDCVSSTYLSARSLVFRGNVLTQEGHTIQLHNLDSHQLIGHALDLGNKTFYCVPYYNPLNSENM